MKKIILVSLLICCINFLSAQKISPLGNLVLEQYQNQLLIKKKPISSIANKYYNTLIKEKSNKKYVNAVITLLDKTELVDIKSLLFNSGKLHKLMFTAKIPLENLALLLNFNSIKYVEISQPLRPFLDSSRSSSKVNLVHSGVNLPQSYKGEGVIVGIVDEGFDFTHPTFLSEDGTSFRIKKVWDQNNNAGIAPTGYGYGTEYSGESTILAIKNDLRVTSSSHGTHVAGIATGSGNGFIVDALGYAPKSDIVMVSTDLDPTSVIDGVEYIFDYATSVGKPAVVNLSLGRSPGARDGISSSENQLISNLTGPGKIIIAAAGNDGGFNMHLTKTLTANDSILKTYITGGILPSDSSITSLNTIWGSAGTNLKARLLMYVDDTLKDSSIWVSSSNPTGIFTDNLNSGNSDDSVLLTFLGSGINPNSNKPYISFIPAWLNTNIVSVAMEVRSTNSIVHAWSDRFLVSPVGSFGNKNDSSFVNGDKDISIADFPATAINVISVGSFTTKKNWLDINNIPHSTTNTIYELAPYSNRGFTVDGRIKPEIVAPGDMIASAIPSFGVRANDSLLIEELGSNHAIGVLTGTSMAAPAVTGTVALMLESDPTLNPQSVRDILIATAIQDTFTGQISSGNKSWGWGKLNAWAAVDSASYKDYSTSVKENPSTNNSVYLYPTISNDIVNMNLVLAESTKIDVSLYDIYGHKIKEVYLNNVKKGKHQLNFSVKNISAGIYIVKSNFNTNEVITNKIIVFE